MRITLNNQFSQEILRNLGIERYAGNVKFALRLEEISLLTYEKAQDIILTCTIHRMANYFRIR